MNKAIRSLEEELDEEEEGVVADLLGEYVERIRGGESIDKQAFLLKCPDPSLRGHLLEALNMSDMMDIHAALRHERGR